MWQLSSMLLTQFSFSLKTLAYLSPLLRAMPMSFSMPPASRRALAFSMFLVMTSCSAQQMAVTVSSDMALLGGPVVLEVPLLVALLLLLLLLPGNRWIKSLMAYLPGGKRKLIKVLFPGHPPLCSQFCYISSDLQSKKPVWL